jgi:uncharacterized membrane protein YhaH (DUF805 family)
MAFDIGYTLTGMTGIALVIALILFVLRSDSKKELDAVGYRSAVRPVLFVFLAVLALFGVELLIVVDPQFSFSLVIGSIVLGVGAVLQYYRPLGSAKNGSRRSSNWIAILVVGLAMILVGALTIPLTQPTADVRIIPLALIGIGSLMALLSVVSFKGTTG